jgi:CheY-like chemotaxis protein
MEQEAGPEVVLVVEDEPLQCADIEEILSAAGFAVIAVGSGREALAVLNERHDVAAVVTDIRMPGEFDGLTVAWRATRGRRPPIPTILVSALVHAETDPFGLNVRSVPKPIRPAVLVDEVRRAIKEAGRPTGALPGHRRQRQRPA